ncbi:hypothetical protein PAHAL_7G199600 [Panicum hallii]|uniref:RING-type domain-containing protein n=1 Tax=Panicum hallii TaxID=206008 RepID=A0A2S3I7T3_9POAL|nr:hypothetical protein PAHAL_7G199600 [Panicum hallii]
MADDMSPGTAVVTLVVGISAPLIIAGSICATYAYRDSLRTGWRRLRVTALGGVTTLERKLSYNCAICQESMDALEVVRTLSCNHVFHRGESDKCNEGIDKWLRTQPAMFCPVCRQTPRPVLPWKAPPPASPADQEQTDSSSGLEDTAPPQPSPDLEDPPLPLLEEPLLPPSQ